MLQDHMKMWESLDEQRGLNKKVRMLQRLQRQQEFNNKESSLSKNINKEQGTRFSQVLLIKKQDG